MPDSKQQPPRIRAKSNSLTQLAPQRTRAKAGLQDTYTGADTGRLLHDLPWNDYTAGQVVSANAARLRARARHLERNNDIVRRALYLTEQNVVGSKGIKLTSMATVTLTGRKMDEGLISLIENQWTSWQKTPDLLNRFQGWRNLLNMLVRRRIVDGEIFLELVPGYRNEHRFSVRVIDPMRVPVGLQDKDKRIRMGIEYDKESQPVAYYVADEGGEYEFAAMYGKRQNYRRVPAERMVHYYIAERPNQCRGVSLIASPMERLHMLDQYEEATLIGARIASSKMGFFYDAPDDENATPYTGTDGGEAQTDPETGEEYGSEQLIDIAAGQFEDIGTKKFTSFDPGYPPARYEEYTTSVLRSISSGLNISYWKLSNDLSDVNYSTAREAKLDDTDAWRRQQQDVIDLVLDPVLSAWLDVQILTPAFSKYTPADRERMQPHKWQPRGWQWVDPQKEMAAVEMKLRHNLTSESIIAEEQGHDFEEILKTRARDEKLLKQYGLQRATEAQPPAEN
jgi:lambda family phage portal protein